MTIKTLPPNLVRDWMLPDGRARVQALPKGDANDISVLQKFATAVLRAEPSATGPAISYYESGKTVTAAFVEAGILALVAIAILLFIALRRITDVLLTLVPLLLAGAVTLEICVSRRSSAQFRQHHRASAAARRRRRVQDLLHHGLARRQNRSAAIAADPRGGVQRHDQCGRVRQHVGIELSRHVEHGQDDGAGAGVHHGRRGPLPTGADGPAAANRAARLIDLRIFPDRPNETFQKGKLERRPPRQMIAASSMDACFPIELHRNPA